MVAFLDLDLEPLLLGRVVDEVRLNDFMLAVVGDPEIELVGLGSVLVDEEASELDRSGVHVDALLDRVPLSQHVDQPAENASLLRPRGGDAREPIYYL